jgi:hypothetical protein
MSTKLAIIFVVALVFYILTWEFICQMVREVNTNAMGNNVSIWRWQKGGRTHKQSFPSNPVRLHLAVCIALTVGLCLVAFCIEVQSKFLHR